MEKRKVAVPDACLGFRFAILPPAGQRSRNKHVLWIPFCYIASGGSKISKKHVPGNKHTHIYSIYSPYSPISAPYRLHIGPYSRQAPW